jgi:hypothetical protein
MTATVQSTTPRITLSWPGDPQATSYTVNRKSRDATSWGTVTSLGAGATSHPDYTAWRVSGGAKVEESRRFENSVVAA